MKRRIMIITTALLALAASLCLAEEDISKYTWPVNLWIPEYDPGYPAVTPAIKDIQMIDDVNAWVVGNDGLVLRQVNDVWSTITITGLVEYNLNAIEMKGQYGWIVGEKKEEPGKYGGILRRTTDGGNTWIAPNPMPPLPSGTAFKDISFANDGKGYIACGNGIILVSGNLGVDWDKLAKTPITEPSDVSGWFNSIYTDPTNSANVRVACDNFGFINHSNNGGDTWSNTPTFKELPDNYYKWSDDTYFDYTLTLAPNKMGHYGWGSWSGSFNHGYIFNGSAFNQIVPDISNGANNVPSAIWFNSLGGTEYGKSKFVGSDGFVHENGDYGHTWPQEDLYASSGGGGFVKYLVGGSSGTIYTHNYLPPWGDGDLCANLYGGVKSVEIVWSPMQEIYVDRYEIFRSISEIGVCPFNTPIGSVPSESYSSTTGNTYSFIDNNATYKRPYHYWIRAIHNDGLGNWIYVGSREPSIGNPTPAPLPTPYNLTVTDRPNDNGEVLTLTWEGELYYYYIGRKLETETNYKNIGIALTNIYNDNTVQNGLRYNYVVQANDWVLQTSAYSASATGVAFDNLAPNELGAPTGSYSVDDKTMTLNWLPSTDEPNLGGYWVCPEPMGVFADKISGIDPGEYEPDAYHVSHASPIDRTQWKWQVPDKLVGQTLIFSVTAMDRSGNIAPWSDQVFINTKALTNSNTNFATAYNNGKHLLYDDKGRLFLVYGSGDSVLFQQSWDDGITWTPSSGFASGGTKPVPVVGYYGTDTTMTWKAETPGVGWVLKSAKRVNNGWGPEATILEAIGAWEQTHYVSPPSMAINSAGTHLAIERVDAQYQIGGQSGVWYWKLLYGFKAAGQTVYSWTVLDSTSGSWGGQDPNLASPTICLDSKGGVHVAWDYEGEIYWRGYDPYLGAWKNKINLTNSPEVFSAEPSLSFYGDVHIVWQEGNDIQHRKGNWGYPRLENTIDAITKSFYWQGVENVNNSPTTASLNPVFDGNYVAWSEQSDVNPEQYNAYFANYSDYVWTSSIDYSKNPSQPSVYPQIAYRQNVDGNKMTTIWTEGTGPLYSLIARDAAGQVTAQAATDVGGEEASIYLIERDGYIVYGATDAIASTGIITVDYDSTALEYYLPTLDRDQKQTMKFTFYQEYPGKIDYIYQVWVDNVSLGSVKVPSGKSVVFEKDLPNAVTHDGEGIIRIVNLKKDKIVTCDKWELYAYDKATGQGGPKKSGGAQLAEEGGKPLTYVYAMAQNAPNPFNGQTRISYQLAKPGNVSLKIYNTLGQLVNTLVDGHQQPGIYSVNWNGKDNSGRTAANGVYFYRLTATNSNNSGGSASGGESGDFKATKKMVLLK